MLETTSKTTTVNTLAQENFTKGGRGKHTRINFSLHKLMQYFLFKSYIQLFLKISYLTL